MAGGETTVEKLQNVDLAAGGGEAVEIKVVDMDIAVPVGLGMLGTEQINFVIGFGTGGTDLEHGTHGGVAVDVGVVPLHIADAGIDVGDLIDGLHQGHVGFSGPGTVGPIEDVSLGSSGETVVHQLALYSILDGFDIGCLGGKAALQIVLYVVGDSGCVGGVALLGCFQGAENGSGDLILIV